MAFFLLRVSVCLQISLLRAFRAHPNAGWPHINFITFAKTLFESKGTFAGNGD